MNILLVRLGALGDVVHAIPVAAALRRQFPSARIDWLVSAKHLPMLDLVPIIDHRLVVDEATSRAAGLFVGIRELRRAGYDLAIDLQGLLKSALLARSSGARQVLGFATTYLRERAARLFYTDAYDPGCRGLYDPRETRHVVQINLSLLESLGLEVGPPEFPIDPIESPVAADVVRRTAGRYALLNPGAQWPNKRWPAERLGQVAARLRTRFGLTSVALWGRGERHLADEIVTHADGAAFASPEASIADLVALSRSATVMVSGDTGPAHIAAAVGTPIVGLYGPTRASRNGPWSADDVTVSRAEICQCHHLRSCRAARMCLLDVEVDEVVAAIARRLATESLHA
jgi:heptosyltransferase-1